MQRLKSRKGQGLVEYILLLVLMALLTVGSLKALGKRTHNAFTQASRTMDKQTGYAAQFGGSEKAIDDD